MIISKVFSPRHIHKGFITQGYDMAVGLWILAVIDIHKIISDQHYCTVTIDYLGESEIGVFIPKLQLEKIG